MCGTRCPCVRVQPERENTIFVGHLTPNEECKTNLFVGKLGGQQAEKREKCIEFIAPWPVSRYIHIANSRDMGKRREVENKSAKSGKTMSAAACCCCVRRVSASTTDTTQRTEEKATRKERKKHVFSKLNRWREAATANANAIAPPIPLLLMKWVVSSLLNFSSCVLKCLAVPLTSASVSPCVFSRRVVSMLLSSFFFLFFCHFILGCCCFISMPLHSSSAECWKCDNRRTRNEFTRQQNRIHFALTQNGVFHLQMHKCIIRILYWSRLCEQRASKRRRDKHDEKRKKKETKNAERHSSFSSVSNRSTSLARLYSLCCRQR